MKLNLKKLLASTALIICLAASFTACESDSGTDTAENKNNVEYPTKERPTINLENADPYDGDIFFRAPSDITSTKGSVEYGTIEVVQYPSSTVGKDRDVSIIFPPNYSTDKEYPVLYVFHGLGQDNTQWINDGKVDKIIGNMLASGECEEMIIVAPNCRAREDDAGNPADENSDSNFGAFDRFYFEFLTDLMPFIENNYPVKTGRENTALAGFSRGGLISLRLGFGNQDMFGYIGSFNVPADIDNYYIDLYDTDAYISYEHLVLAEEYKDNTYIAIVGGKNDDVVSGPATYHSLLEEAGIQHFYCQYAGGHSFSVADKGFYHFAKELFK